MNMYSDFSIPAFGVMSQYWCKIKRKWETKVKGGHSPFWGQLEETIWTVKMDGELE
jgi:hypothetical protein